MEVCAFAPAERASSPSAARLRIRVQISREEDVEAIRGAMLVLEAASLRLLAGLLWRYGRTIGDAIVVRW